MYFYFPRKKIDLPDKYTLWRRFARDFPWQAKMRLEWMIFYETVGRKNAQRTSDHFGISRKTFHKWLKRFKQEKESPQALFDYPKAPHRRRRWEVTLEQEERIRSLRRRHLKWGKKKLKILYKEEFGEEISTWKIERVVRKHSLFPDKVEYQKRLKRAKRRKTKPKVRIHEIKNALSKIKEFGFVWHIDAIILDWYGARRVIFTALEDLTKIAYARVYPTNKSGYAEDFLKRLMHLAQGKVSLMHSDNGGEFEGAFEKACRTLGIIQIYSRLKTPQDNPALERFNWTIQDEWLSLSEVGLDDIEEANQDLTRWLKEYLTVRPHEGIDYQRPLLYAQELLEQQEGKVLPMWSARTASFQP